MFKNMLGKLCAFGHDKSGIVLYLVAFLLVPFITLLAVAVDIGQFLVMKDQLSAAVDSAALNIAANPSLTAAQAKAQAQAFVNANFLTQSQATLSSLTVTQSPPTVNVTASAVMNTSFMQIAGYKTLTATVNSQATVGQNYLELVLVLDNTGSMSQTAGSTTKIQGLITAATELTNTLFASDPTGKYVKIGIVPFTAAVNVGTAYSAAAWMDTTGLGSLTTENLSIPPNNGLLWLYSKGELKNVSWSGCVRQRNEPYDVEDVSPAAATPDTLFTPYFAPDEPDQGSFANNYLSDGSCYTGKSQTQEQADQKCVAKYQNGNANTSNGIGPNIYCPVKQILRLTNSEQAVLNEINGMTPYGNTVIPSGLMWGWHLLSPNGPFGDGVAYSNTTTIKAIVLVTDGDNDVGGGTNSFNKSVYNAYGYGSGPHLNKLSVPHGVSLSQPEYNLVEKTLQLCSNIKAVLDQNGNSRILIYTIGLGTSISATGLNLLQTCASNPSTFFANPTTDELITTFQNIAIGLNKLRLSQ
ncbi:MAG: TadE/TadG family type IV pilus assembly protein [Rhodomicrobium sp.]